MHIVEILTEAGKSLLNGITQPRVLAGLTGGLASFVVTAIMDPTAKINRYVAAGYMVVGIAAANYLAPLVILWIPKMASAESTIGFLIGLTGITITHGIKKGVSDDLVKELLNSWLKKKK